MNSVHFNEYSLTLGTGEKLSFIEFNEDAVEGLRNPKTIESIRGILDKCTRVSHAVMEEAKLGRTKALERALRTPPFGCMMKLDKPICSQIGCCVMADMRKCTTRNCDPKGGKFPECWEYSTETPDGAYIARCIVHAWRQGSYVLIVSAR